MKAIASRQRGVSLSGFLVIIIVFIFVAFGAMKLIPSYMENGKIKKIFDTITHDPEMRNASIKDIRMSFARRADVDGVTAIKMDDIEVVKDGGISLSASYVIKAPLFGNASLLLEFNPSSSAN